MPYRIFGNGIMVRLRKGDEMMAGIMEVCTRESITLAEVSGIGAMSKIVVGAYRLSSKTYLPNTYEGDLEMSCLMGNVTSARGKPHLHLHGCFSSPEGKTYGGHIEEAHVAGTCEVLIRRLNGELRRRLDSETGLNILDL